MEPGSGRTSASLKTDPISDAELTIACSPFSVSNISDPLCLVVVLLFDDIPICSRLPFISTAAAQSKPMKENGALNSSSDCLR
jgi:hypothetical protein